MIITSANAFTRAVHNRMPALLVKKDFEPWLSGAAGTEVLKPADDDCLRMWPVSKRGDQTDGEDDPALIAEVPARWRLPQPRLCGPADGGSAAVSLPDSLYRRHIEKPRLRRR